MDLIVQPLIRPPEPRFEHLGSDQSVDRRVGARGFLRVEHSEGRLVDAAEDFVVEGVCPRGFQSPADLLRQSLDGVKEAELQMFVVLPKHGPLSPLNAAWQPMIPNYTTLGFSALLAPILQESQ